MNLVVINIDTLRTDWLGLSGNEWVKTPYLDAFAADALVFDEAYLASFPTIPCRTDLFTGRSGEPFHPWQALNYLEPTLPEELGRAGWATQLIFDCPHLMQGGTGFDRPFAARDFIRGAEVDKWRLHDREVRIPTYGQGLVGERLMRQQHAQYARNWGDNLTEETMHTARLADSVCRWLEENQRHANSLLWVESFAPHEPWLPPKHCYEPYLNGPASTCRWPTRPTSTNSGRNWCGCCGHGMPVTSPSSTTRSAASSTSCGGSAGSTTPRWW